MHCSSIKSCPCSSLQSHTSTACTPLMQPLCVQSRHAMLPLYTGRASPLHRERFPFTQAALPLYTGSVSPLHRQGFPSTQWGAPTAPPMRHITLPVVLLKQSIRPPSHTTNSSPAPQAHVKAGHPGTPKGPAYQIRLGRGCDKAGWPLQSDLRVSQSGGCG